MGGFHLFMPFGSAPVNTFKPHIAEGDVEVSCIFCLMRLSECLT